jgi:hypothetical protein
MRRARGPWATLLLGACAACAGSGASPDGGADAAVSVIDVCDAFTGVDTACPLPSPVRCFAACDAGGCFCRPTPAGARWACVTDLSCVPDCGPLDDGCGGGP